MYKYNVYIDNQYQGLYNFCARIGINELVRINNTRYAVNDRELQIEKGDLDITVNLYLVPFDEPFSGDLS